MALSVWLPLNGTTENHGSYFDAPITTNGGCSFDNDLGFGSYMKNGIIKISSMKKIFNPRGFSVCMWIYNRQDGVSTMDNSGCFFSWDTMDNRKFSMFQYPTTNDLHLSWINEDDTICVSEMLYGVLDYQQWTHVAMIYTGDRVNVYVNGKLKVKWEVNWVANDFDIQMPLAKPNEHHFVKDVRIYDTEISATEVANLAKGIILHYPMNDIANTMQKNFYNLNSLRSPSIEGVHNDGRNFVSCKYLSNENAINCNIIHTSDGNDCWNWIRFHDVALEAGTYIFGVKYRLNAMENISSIGVRFAKYHNDFSTGYKDMTIDDIGKGWKIFSAAIAVTDKDAKNSTNCIEFCTCNMNTENAVYKADFDVKDISIVEVESDACQLIEGDLSEWHTTTVYDISGFNNNGTVTSGKLILNQASSPRYDASTKFKDDNSLITVPKVFQSSHQGTLNIWVCPHDKIADFHTFIMMGNAFNWNMGLLMGGFLTNTNGAAVMGFSCCGYMHIWEYEENKWYMLTISYDVDNHQIKLYNNGNIIKEVTNDSINSDWLQLMNNCYIGNSAGRTNYSISDFRLYGRMLSDTDVMKLYNTPISLSNTGVLMTQGEFIEPETSEVRKI